MQLESMDEAAVLADLEAMVAAGTLVGRGGDLRNFQVERRQDDLVEPHRIAAKG